MKFKSYVALAIASAMLGVAGCANDNAAPAKKTNNESIDALQWRPEGRGYDPKPQPKAEAPKKVEQPVADTTGMKHVIYAWPSGDPRTSVAILDKAVPAQVQVGAPFEYLLEVRNQSDLCLDDVVVTDRLPASFKVEGSTPKEASNNANTLTWNLGTMNPRETRIIKVRGTATEPGDLQQCATLNCTPRACVTTVVVAPKIKLDLALQNEALICDTIPGKLTVTNTGSGLARNVKINEQLPDGLTADGKNAIAFDAGTLASGQSRDFPVTLKASKTGQFATKATASADGGLSSEASGSTTVRMPVLEIAGKGAAKQYLERSFAHEYTVTNTGDAPSRNTMLIVDTPANAKVGSATEGARAIAGKVQWEVGELAPKASKKFTINLSGAEAGVAKTSASVSGTCAKPADATAQTQLSGIAGILLEMVDITDPIQLGQEETYIITVTNQGTAPDNNIKLVAELEDSMGFVSCGGSTDGKADGLKITFAPVASLAPKAKATWQVKVKALKAGDVRFKVSITSDVLEREVIKTESTHFYE